MGFHYAIKVKLNLKFDENNLKQILKNGQNTGCLYYSDSWPEQSNLAPLTINEAATVIIRNIKLDELPNILTGYDNTLFYLYFRADKQNQITLTLSPLASIWEINDSNGSKTINFANYIRLILNFCEGYAIENLETITE